VDSRDKKEANPKPDCANDAEPDVWWGECGIDTLLWADGIPYACPEPDKDPPADGADDAAGQSQ
jgi:hypothetical protein